MAKGFRTKKRYGNELDFIYTQYARKSNTKLEALERFGSTRYAYQKAQYDIKSFSKDKRYPETPPKKESIVKRIINSMKAFNILPSSTRSGMQNVGNKIAATLNERYPGLKFNKKNIADFFESDLWQTLKMEKEFDSKAIIKGLGMIKQNEKNIKYQLKRFGEYHVHGNFKDVETREFIERMINKEGYTSYEDIFKGYGS